MRAPIAASLLALALAFSCGARRETNANGRGALFPTTIDGARAAARVRDFRSAYAIYARLFLRDPKTFGADPERYAEFVEVCFLASQYKPAVALAKLFARARNGDPRLYLYVKALTLDGRHTEAIQIADSYLRARVGSVAELQYWRSKALFAQGQYQSAETGFAAASTSDAQGLYWFAETLRRQGRYGAARAAAERAAAASSAPHVLSLLTQLVRAERTGIDVRLIRPSAVELSVYHLLSGDGSGPYKSLIEVELANLRRESSEVRVEAELVGFSQRTSKEITLLGHGGAGAPPARSVFLTPSLERAAVLGVGERIQKTLRMRVTRLADNAVVLEDEEALSVLPRDYVAHSRPSPADPDRTVLDDNGHGVLITPRGKWVDGVVAAAKTLHPKRELSGPFADSFSQVRAIYGHLRALGVSYAIGSPTLERKRGEPSVQRIRPPGAALQLRAAQCWEGTNVFASVMEALKLEPVLFKVPGHILVGWRKNSFDTQPGAAGSKYYLLETTVMASAGFEEALRAGSRRLFKEVKAGNLKNGLARFINVHTLRRKGIHPQPWDD